MNIIKNLYKVFKLGFLLFKKKKEYKIKNIIIDYR